MHLIVSPFNVVLRNKTVPQAYIFLHRISRFHSNDENRNIINMFVDMQNLLFT